MARNGASHGKGKVSTMCRGDYSHQINYEGYHSFEQPETDEAFGSFEVCFLKREDAPRRKAGWYWAAGFPGCLWDGDPSGPYDTDKEAYDNAQDVG